MKRDLLLLAFGMIAVSVASWFAPGHPLPPTYFHQDRRLTDDVKLKFITERSEYMRSER